MTTLLTTLTFVAFASAQYTTSIVLPDANFYPDKVGLAGSVVGAENGLTTISLSWDEGVASALSIGEFVGNVTMGPKTMGFGRSFDGADSGCSIPNEGTLVCHTTLGPDRVWQQNCRGTRNAITETSFAVRTYVHTYPARLSYSSGVETVTETMTFLPTNTTLAEWCSWNGFTPSSLTTTYTLSGDRVQTLQLILTAGLDKINVTANPTSASPGNSAPATGSQTANLPQETNAATRRTPGLYGLVGCTVAIGASLV